MRQKPEALQLADLLCGIDVGGLKNAWLNKAAAELRRLHTVEQQRNELALTVREWLEKTEWVQQTCIPAELGMHRADVLRARIDSLSGEILMMRDVLKEAYEVIATIDGDESEMLFGLRNAISHAISPHQRGDFFAEASNE